MLTRWDRSLAGRASAFAGLGALLLLLIVATTDEGAPWALRLGMVAALLPVAGALGTAATIRLAEARGELRALAALGVDPARVVRGAVVGGALIALVGAALAASGLADLRGLFPRPTATALWIVDGAGMRERALGITLGPGGVLGRVAPEGPSVGTLPAGIPVWTVLTIVLSALAGPVWTGAPGLGLRRLTAGMIALLGAVIAFQAVAAGRLPAPALLACPLILLIDGALARYLARRHA